MTRGITDQLPESARDRLTELTMERDSTMDAMRSAQSRINSLPVNAVQLRDKLSNERDRFAEKHRQVAMLVNRVNQYVVELRVPPGAIIEPSPAIDLKLKPSDSLPDALANLRQQISAINAQIAQVRSAPLKRASKEEACWAYIAKVAQRAGPKVSFDIKGNARVTWAEDLVASRDDLLGVLTWIFGAQPILAAFARDLDGEPDAPNAVTPLEREQQLGKLTNDLLALERREEALIERAAAGGIELTRRPEASPMAVLQIVISSGQQAQQRAVA
jgi:hypothetical protein